MIYYIISVLIGLIIGYIIHGLKCEKHGFLVIEDSKWIVDLHLPLEEVLQKKFITLQVVKNIDS